MNNIFEEYGLLESQIAALELKKSQLRPFILQKMIDDKMKSLDTAVGKFSLSNRKVWAYPEEVKTVIDELSEEIKTVKARAESSKIATYEEIPSLRFNPVKL